MCTVLCVDMAELNLTCCVCFTRKLLIHLISRVDPQIHQLLHHEVRLYGVERATEVNKHDFHKTVCLF